MPPGERNVGVVDTGEGSSAESNMLGKSGVGVTSEGARRRRWRRDCWPRGWRRIVRRVVPLMVGVLLVGVGKVLTSAFPVRAEEVDIDGGAPVLNFHDQRMKSRGVGGQGRILQVWANMFRSSPNEGVSMHQPVHSRWSLRPSLGLHEHHCSRALPSNARARSSCLSPVETALSNQKFGWFPSMLSQQGSAQTKVIVSLHHGSGGSDSTFHLVVEGGARVEVAIVDV